MSDTPDHPMHPPEPTPVPTPAPTPTPRAPERPEPQIGDASLSQVIDTIEAIIIALIVALTFRAFIVEAFVIPTGSMGPTLLGAHYKVICPECGYAFDLEADISVALREDMTPPVIPPGRDAHAELRNNKGIPLPMDRPGHEAAIVCPNCRYEITPEQLPQYLSEESRRKIQDGRLAGAPLREVPFVWANNGDRILVMKYLYSVMEPTRWDVIVFKEPKATQDNFIKRLAGLPGDTLEIIDGDVYIWPEAAHAANDASKFEIARKPRYLQSNLWQLVYDNDCFPIDAGGGAVGMDGPVINPRRVPFVNPWESTAAWKGGPVMVHDAAGPAELTFNLTASQARDLPYTLNTLGYNNDFYPGRTNDRTPRNYCGDLRLEATWMPAGAADGASVAMTLGRPSNCYRVEWSASGLKLLRYNMATKAFEAVAATTMAVAPPEAGKAYRLAMNNVDRSIQFTIDGTEALSFEQTWTAQMAEADEAANPSIFGPDSGIMSVRGGSPDAKIQIQVSGQAAVSHLKLFRDLYYTQTFDTNADNPPTGTEGHAITLKQDEFFALGDNSRKSSDSRFWDGTFDAAGDLGLRNGIVPRRYLLGKAFFVYWPAGFRANDSLPLLNNLPLVPNTGNMRIIR